MKEILTEKIDILLQKKIWLFLRRCEMESEEFRNRNKWRTDEGRNLPSAAVEPSLRQTNLPDWRQTGAFTFVQAAPKQDFS